MAVSINTQRGMYGDHATSKHYFSTKTEAKNAAEAARNNGARKVQVRAWNNGTRQFKRIEYIVNVWN